jgi:hypothetical protein
MEVVYPRCAGLDVHKKMVVVCVLITRPNGSVQKEIRTFLRMTADLLALDEWRRSFQVEQVALESTGVYTPAPMLQIGRGSIKRERRRKGTAAKNHAELLFIELHPFD